MNRTLALQLMGLVAVGVASRLIPHPPNMTAIGAIGLKSRAIFGTAGAAVPLVSMALADVVLGFYEWRLLLSVYVTFAILSLLGALLKRTSLVRIICVALVHATIFFLVTNTMVWALSTWYPATLAGYLAALTAGIPFFISMAVGDALYSFALFRGPVWYTAVRRCAAPPQVTAAY